MVADGGIDGWITPNLNYLQVGLYSLGSMVFVACMQIARNFAWAFVTKLPRAKDRRLALPRAERGAHLSLPHPHSTCWGYPQPQP